MGQKCQLVLQLLSTEIVVAGNINMGKKHKPRSGSLAFYPRKRAKRELASFRTMSVLEQKPRALNFVGYKAGMVHGVAKNQQQKTTSFGQQIVVPLTVIECPPLTVFGARFYSKRSSVLQSIGEVTVDKFDKHFRKRFSSFKKKSQKKNVEKEGKKSREEKNYSSLADFEKQIDTISAVRLLAATKPSALDFGKKVVDVFEVFLGGSVAEQFAFAKEKIGKEISVNEVFEEKGFVDVRAVDVGKGFSGVVKRFGVKIHRRKAKKRRVVGSIGPWNPSTVMRTVARPGQLGYQSRTELNKRILKISDKPEEINVAGGFEGYGNVKSSFVLLSGSTPGPVKRAVALRLPVRKADAGKFNVLELKVVGIKKQGKKVSEEEEVKAQKVVVRKEEKQEKKSVEDEIREAAGGKK